MDIQLCLVSFRPIEIKWTSQYLAKIPSYRPLSSNREIPKPPPMNINDTKETLIVTNANLSGSTFTDVSLHQAQFTDVNLSESKFCDINFSNSTFSNVNLSNVEIHNCDTSGMRIHGILVSELLSAHGKSI